jgi:hypothetical protein
MWGGISINGDNDVPGNSQEYNSAYTETRVWHNFPSHRSRWVDAGPVTITLLFRSASNGWYNGMALVCYLLV